MFDPMFSCSNQYLIILHAHLFSILKCLLFKYIVFNFDCIAVLLYHIMGN